MPEQTEKSLGTRLREIFLLFFRLGATAFGGPAAYIGMMEDEVVERRGWMTREHFLDLVGATNLIPGPNAIEMAIHCGYHYAGVPGLLIAGLSFIVPATTLTILVAWVYVRYGALPAVEPFFVGIRPAVLAIIVSAVLSLGKKALKGWQLGVIGAVVIVAVLLGMREITAILGGGAAGMLWLSLSRREAKVLSWAALPFGLLRTLLQRLGQAVDDSIPLSALFLSFLKVGAVLFGSGYVLVAYLEDELVNRLGWLTRTQLLDAIAAGQFTPGPLLSSSAFVGYILRGLPGALVANAAIVLPSFIFVLILNPQIPKLRQSRWASAFLDAVNISAVGIMVATALKLAQGILVDWRALVIALASAAVMFLPKHRINSAWIVLGGALLGYVLGLV